VEHTAITFDLAPWSVKDRTLWFQQFADSKDKNAPHRCYVAIDAQDKVLAMPAAARFSIRQPTMHLSRRRYT
ncbi:MAG: hypothetical protein QMB60_03170, partial [Pseudomonadales bacterium]